MATTIQIPAAEFKLVNMETHRCYECGRCWALETFASTTGACPCCSQRQITKLEAALVLRDRCIVALRGVITRKKKGGRRAR
jgi:hypothetical protein